MGSLFKISFEKKVTPALIESTTVMQNLTVAVLRLEETARTSEREERKIGKQRQEMNRARLIEGKREAAERKWKEKRWDMGRIARGSEWEHKSSKMKNNGETLDFLCLWTRIRRTCQKEQEERLNTTII